MRWRMATSSVAAAGLLLLGAAGLGKAQSNEGQPPLHSLSGAAGKAAPSSQPPALNSRLLGVPLVNNVPGGVKPSAIANPVAQDPAAAERGMRYFLSFNCVGCHAPNGGGGMGPALSNKAFKYGADPAHLFLVISHGAPLGMPAWGNVLPENVIWDLVAYVESISNEPDPEWGHTVSPAADVPAVQQVPVEFKQTASPWQFVQPFGNGQAPSASASGAQGVPVPASGSSSK
jgi:cytochrome c oxidase cbb3-type subunit 3